MSALRPAQIDPSQIDFAVGLLRGLAGQRPDLAPRIDEIVPHVRAAARLVRRIPHPVVAPGRNKEPSRRVRTRRR
jgi:hypothetical protein